MRIRMMILAVFWMGLAGCASTSVYVLDQSELIRGKAGQIITLKFDSWILSDRAVQRVMDAKIKGVNLQ